MKVWNLEGHILRQVLMPFQTNVRLYLHLDLRIQDNTIDKNLKTYTDE